MPSKTSSLTSGDIITFNIEFENYSASTDIGLEITPVSITVPELGEYITHSSQLTLEICMEILDAKNWINAEGEWLNKYKTEEAYYAYIPESNEIGSNSPFGIVVILDCSASVSFCPYRCLLIYNIKTLSNGKVEAQISNPIYGSIILDDAYKSFKEGIGKDIDIIVN